MQTRIDPIARFARYQFDSLGELGAWIERTPRTWSTRSSEKEGRDMDWDLNAGYQGAVNMARNGWLEGAEKAQEALKTFAPKSPQPDTRTDVYGFRPHVPRFCAGAPDSMIRHADVAETGAGKVLTLVVPINAMAMTDARYMANFGVAVAQYVNQLETDGTRVELYAGLANTFHSGWRSAYLCRIKNADQPLDLAVVAFAIGHPAMFRRLGFALIERGVPRTEHGYGSTANMTPKDLINTPPGTVILNGMKDAHRCAPTPKKGLEYVAAQIDAAIRSQEL